MKIIEINNQKYEIIENIDNCLNLEEIKEKVTEYFDNFVLGKETERDLLDLLEMVADWISYKDDLRYSEASELVKKQCERYGFSEEISDLLLNTLKNYYVEF